MRRARKTRVPADGSASLNRLAEPNRSFAINPGNDHFAALRWRQRRECQ
jgi:hypothetical protein